MGYKLVEEVLKIMRRCNYPLKLKNKLPPYELQTIEWNGKSKDAYMHLHKLNVIM